MAWKVVTGFKKLIVRYSNGHGDEVYDNVAFPSMRMTDATSLVTNGFTGYDTGLLGAANYQQPDLYALYSSFTSNGLNLVELLGNLNSNGEYFEVYNPEIGTNYRIRFTRKSAYTLEIRYFVYSQSTGTGYNISLIRNEASYFDSKYCFGFVADIPNGRANIVFRYNWQYNESTPGHTIAYYRVNNGPYVNQDICSQCLMGLILANEMPEPPAPSEDPYADGGFSETGGGGGDFDDSSDAINLPSVPSLNLTLNHFISAYVPTLTDIDNLADWIWGNYDKFDSNKVLGKLFTEPMDSILSLHMLPYTPSHSTAITVTIGNFSTGLQMSPLSKQFEDIDCGSLSFSEFWGNYLDYNPYTKIVLCLPFVGQVDLDADEVMGKTIKVKYRVDSLTGAFVCFVYIDSDKIIGQYSGECMLQVPVTAASYAQMNAAIASIACTAAAGFGGATAAAIGGGYGGMIGIEKGLQMGGQALGETLASGASNVNGMKLQVSHSGALTGTAGFLGVMKPYAIIHRPRQCVPEKYNEMAGYPSNVTMTLGDCSGFTSVRTMVYDGLPFTDGEILALDSILKGGVII